MEQEEQRQARDLSENGDGVSLVTTMFPASGSLPGRLYVLSIILMEGASAGGSTAEKTEHAKTQVVRGHGGMGNRGTVYMS